MNLKMLTLGRKVMTNLDSIFKSRDITLLTSQGYGFSCGHVWMWVLDCEEGWAPKNWCFWTVVLEKTLEGPLDCKEIQPVHSEGDQPWDFFGSNNAKAEAPVLWPPHAKTWLIGKDSDAGRDWGQEEKGTTQDDGWMASLTRCTWVWVNSGSWWWTGRPGVLRFMGLQRVGHDWATELNRTEYFKILKHKCYFQLSLYEFVFSFALDTFTCLKLQEAVKGKYAVKSFLSISNSSNQFY